MKKISVIGSGMTGISQITKDGFEVINNSKIVLWIGSILGLSDYLLEKNISCENLSHLYKDGGFDVDNYVRIIDCLMTNLHSYSNICLVVPGHPRVGVTIVQLLQQRSKEDGFEFRCYPGISSFDAMINDLGIDPLEEGVGIVDANRLIIYDYAMEPCVNYFIYHVCSVGNANTDYSSPHKNNKISYLKNKLLKHYAPENKIFLLSASVDNSGEPDKIEGSINNLDELFLNITYRHTLYIPALLPSKDRVNFEFLNEIGAI
ncbi:SAM-dependent methyltransferase [Aeromonas sp. MdU4]|uniref:SAM-dependent methyltransferase n=1 Tax=Aeromonas sp. MdU4 TaxID=3342819 RepID=UPI0035B764A3